MVAFKLVYRSGYVNCRTGDAYQSIWGCKDENNVGYLAVHITDHQKQRILPTDAALFDPEPNCLNNILYSLPGVTSDSPVLRFSNFSSPLPVTTDQEFQIWYAEDLYDCFEDDNDGQTCTDIYGLYL